jgi:hypothetical protein
MFGTPKAIRRIVEGAVIASTILLRPSALPENNNDNRPEAGATAAT